MNLLQLDLNLLVALDALLQRRSVSEAARQLGLGQPALSGSLRRLRRHFDDELLVRVGASYQLTPLAERLLPRVELAVSDAERVFGARDGFDPASSERSFRLLVGDWALRLVGPALAARAHRTAPHARLELLPAAPPWPAPGERLLLSHDLVVASEVRFPGCPHTDLVLDRWVVAASDTGTARNPVDTAQLSRSPWILLAEAVPALDRLRAQGLDPHVALLSHSCAVVLDALAGSEALTLLPEALVRRLPPGRVRALATPLTMPPCVQAMWWHPSQQVDQEHALLRSWLELVSVEVRRGTDRQSVRMSRSGRSLSSEQVPAGTRTSPVNLTSSTDDPT